MNTNPMNEKIFNRVGYFFAAAALGLATSSVAYAAGPGWSIGASVGQSKSKWDNDDISSFALDPAFTTDTTDSDDQDTAFKVFFGYQMSQYFSIETGYFDLGQSTFTMNTLPMGKLNNQTEVQGVNIDAVGMLPLTDMFSIFARVGATYAETKVSFTGSGIGAVGDSHDSNKETNYKLGAGLQLNFSENFGARLEAESYRLSNPQDNEDSIEVASLGVVYRFAQ